MSEATHTPTTRRRGLLAGAAAAAVVTPAAAGPRGDAELIRWCAEYLAAVRDYEAAVERVFRTYRRGLTQDEEAVLEGAIKRAEAEVDARPPQTLAGVLALAQVGQSLVTMCGGGDGDWGGWASDWSVASSQALLRLAAEGRV